jgi:MYXO-CTERM domain-containing protein
VHNAMAIRLALPATIVAVALSVPGLALGSGLRPDDRAGLRGAGATSAAASPVVRPDDRGGIRSVDPAIGAAIAEHTRPEPDGFDWTAAGTASSGALLVLVLAAAVVVRRSHRSVPGDA